MRTCRQPRAVSAATRLRASCNRQGRRNRQIGGTRRGGRRDQLVVDPDTDAEVVLGVALEALHVLCVDCRQRAALRRPLLPLPRREPLAQLAEVENLALGRLRLCHAIAAGAQSARDQASRRSAGCEVGGAGAWGARVSSVLMKRQAALRHGSSTRTYADPPQHCSAGCCSRAWRQAGAARRKAPAREGPLAGWAGWACGSHLAPSEALVLGVGVRVLF